jgi:Cu/Ag efflux protein CusF
MKTTILVRTARTLFTTALISAFAVCAHADGTTAAKEKTYSGTITAVDAKEKVVKVQGYLLTKTFVLADKCELKLGDKHEASLGDFRPGQRVDVVYKDAGGVLVANRISQELLRFSGEVTAIDRAGHTIAIHDLGLTRTFAMADDLGIVLNGSNRGTLDDVKLGSQVTVTYEIPNNQFVARQIESRRNTFVGALSAVSLPDRTIRAGKSLLGDKKFHLTDNCVIVINGKTDAKLSDLQVGQNYEFDYEVVDGVNVVNRIAPVDMPAKPEVSQQTAN